MSYTKNFLRDGERLPVQLQDVDDGVFKVNVGEHQYEVLARRLPDGHIRFVMDGETYDVVAAPAGKNLQVRLNGQTHVLEHHRGGASADVGEASGSLHAPMTGTIQKIMVKPGDEVVVGQTLLVLTAMKMEHKLTAGIAGLVGEILVKEGDNVEQDALLLQVEPAAEA